MNAEKLMQIIGDAEDGYIQSAEATRKPKKEHRTISFVSKIVLVAAIMMSLVVTAYATDGSVIKTLTNLGWDKYYDSYQKLNTAMEKAGFEIDAREAFDNGYVFENMSVSTTQALDENRNKLMSFKDIRIDYKNQAENHIGLSAHLYLECLTTSETPVKETRQIGGINVEYRVSHYKFFPASKEGNLTEEEELWQQQPGNYISYGSTSNPAGIQAHEDTKTALTWTKDGISYLLMDYKGVETADTLFAMAEELING